LSAAWLLSKRHRVTIYEKEPRAGGHSNTVDVQGPAGPIPVDTGFIVYNTLTYPNLTALFTHLGVPTRVSNMSFSASLRGASFEYAGTSLNGLFGQRSNLFSPRFWGMIKDLLRFYETAPAVLGEADGDLSLGEYLAREGYGERFVHDHLLPMGAAIWSATRGEMMAYPARSFVAFFQSHGLLLLKGRPQWRTVEGGSREYVRRLSAPYAREIRYTGVRKVSRTGTGVCVEDEQGHSDYFDDAVIATHADEALRLLADADPHERALLGKWRYTENTAVLHQDPALMPKRRRVWASWNFIERDSRLAPDGGRLCVTYWMNLLQGLPGNVPLFVTLNPAVAPAEQLVHNRIRYSHPFFDQGALWSQQRLWSLQGRRNTWFCGSYFGHGFHEDALQSGLAVAEQLGGVRRPWDVPGESARITMAPSTRWSAAA
jgi:predicted NAD/FAD-binding protein